MMWWWGDGHMGAAGWIGSIFMILIWILIVAGIVFLIRSFFRAPSERHPGYWGPLHYGHGGPGMRMGNPEAMRLLEERYARGEIDRAEFLQKKADLTGQAGGFTGQPSGQPGDQPPGQSS